MKTNRSLLTGGLTKCIERITMSSLIMNSMLLGEANNFTKIILKENLNESNIFKENSNCCFNLLMTLIRSPKIVIKSCRKKIGSLYLRF